MDILAEMKSAVRDVRFDISEHLAHERELRRNDEDGKADIRAARADELRKWDCRLTRLLAGLLEGGKDE